MSNPQIIPLANFINVTISSPPAGLVDFSVNNLLYITKEVPVNPSLGAYAVYVNPLQVASDWGTGSEIYAAANNIFGQAPNILSGQGVMIAWPMASSDTITSACTAAQSSVFFGGAVFGGYDPADAEITAGAAACMAGNYLLFCPRYNPAAVQGGGVLANIQAATQTKARGLLYTLGALPSRLMAAAYASRGMSVNFNGSNTTLTMQFKTLTNVVPDPNITETLYTQCLAVGADIYVDTAQNLPIVISTGGNDYFDNQDNLLALYYDLEVAGFNAMRTTPTKVPQTEPGITTIKNAIVAVLQKYVNNGFIAPGAWNNPFTFGSPTDLIANVAQVGWYIYSQPVNLQSQTQRAQRQAPLIQVAIKYAGAVQGVTIGVFTNS